MNYGIKIGYLIIENGEYTDVVAWEDIKPYLDRGCDYTECYYVVDNDTDLVPDEAKDYHLVMSDAEKELKRIKERHVESFFGIPVFAWKEYNGIDESGNLFVNVEFFLESLKQYNGLDINVLHDWAIDIWTDEGKKLDSFSLIEVPEFREALQAIVSKPIPSLETKIRTTVKKAFQDNGTFDDVKFYQIRHVVDVLLAKADEIKRQEPNASEEDIMQMVDTEVVNVIDNHIREWSLED
ncbi:hypothetical protein PP175_25850 (plasmid) [Aneurinibacillus sp. Ricciae_BoGa-3]|uniref:hypothetical protein n=1 Tax=Aneurinibacillus sp. Ricciae_BoGa-3 TaxID=3022697 RepID=UPI002341E76F|nr:hypothetical protein [Aneurinibacillus sp. Ricciae_BoGa-3]WCK57493.1 hypothetical protein PP175_25850 [Aneurinibacillus sp. Ricciae_BoGa-3]